MSFGTATAALSQRVPSRSPPRRLRRRPKPAVPPRCPPFRGVSPHGALGVPGAASPPPPPFPFGVPVSPSQTPLRVPSRPPAARRHGSACYSRCGPLGPCQAVPGLSHTAWRKRRGRRAGAVLRVSSSSPRSARLPSAHPPPLPAAARAVNPLRQPLAPCQSTAPAGDPRPGLSSLQEAVAVLRGFFPQIQRAQPAASTAVHEGCSQAPEPWRQAAAEAAGFRNTCTLSRQTSLAKTGL